MRRTTRGLLLAMLGLVLAMGVALGATPREALADTGATYTIVVKNGDNTVVTYEHASLPAECSLRWDQTGLTDFKSFSQANGNQVAGDGNVVSAVSGSNDGLTFTVNSAGEGGYIGGTYGNNSWYNTIFYFHVSCTQVTGVTLDPPTAQTIDVGGKVSFTATITPDNAADKKVKWSVTGSAVTLFSDSNCTSPIATGTAISTSTVYAKGTAAGSATVTVTTNDGSKTASCDVTVNKANAVAATVTANSRTYDGTEKPLVTVTGEATGGEMQYALGTATEATQPYTTSIPAKTDVGTYHVWYRVAGDENHNGTEAQKVTSTIAPKAFPDVPEGAWFRDVVYRAVGLGLFSGYGDGGFGPNDKVTRGQAATVLWNMAGHPEPEPGAGAKPFPDVDAKEYYASAIAWATKIGVVNGYGNGNFGPNDNVQREQLAVMIANYARVVASKDTAGSAGDYGEMRDADKVSEWARSSVGWCFKSKIISGNDDGHINPQGNATRAEAAKMLVYLRDLPQA